MDCHGESAVVLAVCYVLGRSTDHGFVTFAWLQCQLDEHSPLAREWALWAVRNLCAGSPEAQQRIKDLEVRQLLSMLLLIAQLGSLDLQPRARAMVCANRLLFQLRCALECFSA